MTKKVLIYGGIAGVIILIVMMISMAMFEGPDDENMDYRTGEIVGYATIILSQLAIFFGIKAYRDKDLGGHISFGKGFLLGTLISGVASFIFFVYTVLLYTVIDPDVHEKMRRGYIRMLEESGSSASEIAQATQMWEQMPSHPAFQGLVMFVTVLMIGLVISAISSAILKKKRVASA